MISVKQVTFQYENGKGVFDLNFEVRPGEVVGYLGPNGAGKSTTIRCLLGFMQVDAGACTIGGRDCFTRAPEIQRQLGYIPGEIAFFDKMTGSDFLQFISELRGVKNLRRQKELTEMFELDPRGPIKKFSKGMKQKVGIVAAFMHEPEVLILDEPTSGLDPLMQNRFIDLVLAQKRQGKTILMSSHLFEEVEKSVDRVLVIKQGRIVAEDSIQKLKDLQKKVYLITLASAHDAGKLKKFQPQKIDDTHFQISIQGKQINQLLQTLCPLKLLNLQSQVQSLEEVFLNYYGQSKNAA